MAISSPLPPRRTTSRVVVVTGASAGVGRATAVAFASQGASVALLARGLEGLGATAAEVQRAGGTPLVIALDVANDEQVQSAAQRVEDELGPIDVWVNNAMVSIFSPFTDVSAKEFRRVTEVTYLGCVYGTMAALSHMAKRDRGIIVQVGSALAYRGIPLQSAYCGAKHGVQGFTESLRCELLHERSNVNVTMVQLPALNTPQFDWVLSRLPRRTQPVPPIYQPEVAARAILRAVARPTKREHWVGWSTAGALIGDRLAPGLLDRYLARNGFDAQQTEETVDIELPSNLWDPVTGSHRVHGRFDARAHDTSTQAWAAEHRSVITGLMASAAGLFGVFRLLRHHR